MGKVSVRFLFSVTTFCAIFATQAWATNSIVGGDIVDDQSVAPYMVQLPGGCGGSVIDEKWILTGAHCIFKDYYFYMNGGSTDSFHFPETYSISKTFIHPKYERIIYDLASRYDYALVKLEHPIDFANSNIKKVRIADPAFAVEGQKPGVMATVFGWGMVDENDRGPTELLHSVQVPIVSMEIANQGPIFNHYIENEDTMLPAGYIEGGKDACGGDSGGPLVLKDQVTGETVQVGIVSWGVGCARENKFGIYSKVSAAYEWIQATIKANSN